MEIASLVSSPAAAVCIHLSPLLHQLPPALDSVGIAHFSRYMTCHTPVSSRRTGPQSNYTKSLLTMHTTHIWKAFRVNNACWFTFISDWFTKFWLIYRLWSCLGLSRIDPDPGLGVWGEIGGMKGAALDWWGIFGACHRVLKKPRTKNIRRYSLQKDFYKNVYMLKIRDTKVEHELEFNPSWTSTKLSQGKCQRAGNIILNYWIDVGLSEYWSKRLKYWSKILKWVVGLIKLKIIGYNLITTLASACKIILLVNKPRNTRTNKRANKCSYK